jgi:hypothetical protein
VSPVHRPLSAWIAHLEPDSGQLGPVNDGDDSADAREMPYFSDGWQRVAVPTDAGTAALGLTSGDATVVELDDFGAPIPASDEALRVITRLEQRWPVVDDEIQRLADEALPLRYWLLERLASEGEPQDDAFAILPWRLLDRAVAAVRRGLGPENGPGELVEIRHWLTPAVRGLTGPLEQLDHGLRVGDDTVARLGAYALLANLRDLPVSRIPEHSRRELDELVRLLGGLDSAYLHMARVASARLADQPAVSRLRTELHSNLVPAASTDDAREHVEVLGDDTQRIRLTQNRAGRVRVVAHLLPSTMDSPLGRPHGVFQPVRITPRGAPTPQRFWIALYPDDDQLVGSLTFGLAPGLSTLDADDGPVGAEELAAVDPAELVRSLLVSTARTAERWLDLAERLPVRHPVRVAATAYDDGLEEPES